jgi:hypothetical protein
LSGFAFSALVGKIKLSRHPATIRPEAQMTTKYMHHVYADASGDDGFKFEDKDAGFNGSSYWFSIAPVIMKVQDVDHNKRIVLGLKRIIGSKPRDEITWRRLRKHKKRQECLEKLSESRVQLMGIAVGKLAIQDEQLRDPHTKILSFLLHTFWLDVLSEMFPAAPPKSILVMVDTYKAGLVDFGAVVRDYANRRSASPPGRKDHLPSLDPFDIKFERSVSIQLLQLADIFAGIVRDLFEGLRGQQLPPCPVCLSRHWRRCPWGSEKTTIGDPTLMKILSLFLAKGPQQELWEYSLLVRPPEVAPLYLFLDCSKK